MTMYRGLAKAKGAGFILWHARHMVYHVLIGLMWAWFLRERWGEFNPLWIWTAVAGSILPDVDHFFYFFGSGKQDQYTRNIVDFLKRRQWRSVVVFIENGHKNNTNLSFHNIYITGIFLVGSWLSSFVDWEVGVIVFGAVVSHYLFDMFDDFVQLGTLNANWKRWGRGRRGYT